VDTTLASSPPDQLTHALKREIRSLKLHIAALQHNNDRLRQRRNALEKVL
jgi:hypothetical protein